MSSPRHRNGNVVLRDGSTVHVRPVRAEDAPAVRAFFEGLSPESIALRFFCGFPDLDRAVRWATEVDQHRYGLVATGADGRVVAHAGWERDPDRPERAEVAFAIADATQHNGLGTILLGQLIEAADQAGVAVLSAEVLPQNHRMIHVFRDSGFLVTTRTLPGVVLVELATSRSPAALARFSPRLTRFSPQEKVLQPVAVKERGTEPGHHPDSRKDLNEPAVIQADGVLFRKGEGQPEELLSRVVFDRASAVRRKVDPV
jgi:L-amino acid N-acyltransferase YncA